jgi:hypothetical protein
MFTCRTLTQVIPGVPDSRLHPSITKSAALVRVVTSPLFLNSNQARMKPDGVMILGDIVSGALLVTGPL